jgi:hypothetical protein
MGLTFSWCLKVKDENRKIWILWSEARIRTKMSLIHNSDNIAFICSMLAFI